MQLFSLTVSGKAQLVNNIPTSFGKKHSVSDFRELHLPICSFLYRFLHQKFFLASSDLGTMLTDPALKELLI